MTPAPARARCPIPYTLTPLAHAALDAPGAGAAARPVTVWRHVATLVAWLDAAHPRTDHEIACRIMKLAEETGEAVAAYIGMTGQNPRKGHSATADDLASELCDVIVTAMVALATITGPDAADAEAVLQAHLSARFTRLIARISAPAADIPADPRACHLCGEIIAAGQQACPLCGDASGPPGEGEWCCQRCGAGFFSTAPDHGLCPDCDRPDGAR